ncbi:MAG: zinc-binding dehydrogenase [Spirochaetes bacterium]|nr:zinc-binding dehydrogenase [Spirochaetota bacterium]
MRAAMLSNNGFTMTDIEKVKPADGEVLVRSLGNGICEGDVFKYREALAGAPVDTTVPLGHEGSGIIEAVGHGVSGYKPGDRVTALGGAYADYFACPASALVKLETIDPVMALGEPLACCVHAASRFGISYGDRVAVIGSGFMGLMCLQLAQLRGAGYTAAFDVIPWRLSAAKEFGADDAFNSNDFKPTDTFNADSVARELGEFDVVIEATGVPGAVTLATDLVKQHGTLVLVGYHQSNDGMRSVNMKTWNFKAITVVNGHVRRSDEKYTAMAQAMKLLAAKRIRLDGLITNYPFESVSSAFTDLVNRKEGLFKANLVFQK